MSKIVTISASTGRADGAKTENCSLTADHYLRRRTNAT